MAEVKQILTIQDQLDLAHMETVGLKHGLDAAKDQHANILADCKVLRSAGYLRVHRADAIEEQAQAILKSLAPVTPK